MNFRAAEKEINRGEAVKSICSGDVFRRAPNTFNEHDKLHKELKSWSRSFITNAEKQSEWKIYEYL